MAIQTKLYVNKITLTLNKPAYTGMCILELTKVLMYEFHYYYIKNMHGSNSRLLFTDTDSLTHEIRAEDVYEDFSNTKEMFDFSNYSTKSNYDNANKIVVGKMTDETAGVATEEFVGLKPKMYLYLVNDNSELIKTKSVNRDVVATISHNEYKDISLNKKCLRHLINRIQNKDHKKETYEINKISLSCFDDKIDKICIQNNGCDELALGY